MSLGIVLLIVGLILAVLGYATIGIVLVVIGAVLLITGHG